MAYDNLLKGRIISYEEQDIGYQFKTDNGLYPWIRSSAAIRKLATAFGIASSHESYIEQLVGKEIYFQMDMTGIVERVAPASVVDGVDWIDANKLDPVQVDEDDGTEQLN